VKKKNKLEQKSHAKCQPDKINVADTSELADLAWCIMDLYNTEKHLAFTVMRTKKQKYLNIYNEIRIRRTKMLSLFKKLSGIKTEADVWCTLKHMLGAIMQTSEIAIREMYKGNKEQAMELFKIQDDLWTLFWAIVKG